MFGYSKKMFIPSSKMERERYFKAPRFNANVFKIDFNILADKDKIAMGDPIFCKKCQAAISCLSNPEKVKENMYKWDCEFCGQENLLENIEEEEIPKDEDLCFVLESNIQKNDKMVDENQENDDISVVFCIDFSGSMNVTQELKNQNALNIDNKQLQELENFKQFMEPNEYQQYKQMVMQSMNKFISRKDCVLAAIKDQVQELKKTYPNRKIGLVTFNDEVVVLGDGVSEHEQVITGDKLQDYETVYEESKKYAATHMKVPVSTSAENLINKFQQLKPEGKTALAPALLTSIGLIENAKAGSQIILCTDGLANMGFGSLDCQNDEQQQAQEVFYKQIGDLAVEKGIKVSIITVKGEECKVVVLGQIAEKTQGKVTRVNPENIHNDFASILKDEVIATQTQLKVWLHKGLQFKNTEIEESVDIVDGNYVRKIGNVTKKTQVSFEYDLKSEEDLKKLEMDMKKLGKLPFQAQIRYENPKGDLMIRILSKNQEIAQEEDEVHKVGNIDVIQRHQTHLNRNYALKGMTDLVGQQQQQYDDFMGYNNSNNNWSTTLQQQQVQQAQQQQCKMKVMNNKKAKVQSKKMQKSYQQPNLHSNNNNNNYKNYQQNQSVPQAPASAFRSSNFQQPQQQQMGLFGSTQQQGGMGGNMGGGMGGGSFNHQQFQQEMQQQQQGLQQQMQQQQQQLQKQMYDQQQQLSQQQQMLSQQLNQQNLQLNQQNQMSFGAVQNQPQQQNLFQNNYEEEDDEDEDDIDAALFGEE